MSELHDQNGMLVMERSCQWKGLHWPAPFSSDFPLTFLTETHPVTGETRITLRDTDFNELLRAVVAPVPSARGVRSEEHTSELQSLMRTSYAVFCLKKKNTNTYHQLIHI